MRICKDKVLFWWLSFVFFLEVSALAVLVALLDEHLRLCASQ